jgi:hypothetical protein
MTEALLERERSPGEGAASPAPAGLALARQADGRLTAQREGRSHAVWVRPAFPWTEPARFLSLRDEDEEELALIEDVTSLDPVSRIALEEALVVAGFVLEVTRVVAVEEEVEVRHWTVETRQGPRSFQTRLDEWPRSLPHGGLLIRDVAGDLYHFRDPAALDRESRALLWVFVD